MEMAVRLSFSATRRRSGPASPSRVCSPSSAASSARRRAHHAHVGLGDPPGRAHRHRAALLAAIPVGPAFAGPASARHRPPVVSDSSRAPQHPSRSRHHAPRQLDQDLLKGTDPRPSAPRSSPPDRALDGAASSSAGLFTGSLRNVSRVDLEWNKVDLLRSASRPRSTAASSRMPRPRSPAPRRTGGAARRHRRSVGDDRDPSRTAARAVASTFRASRRRSTPTTTHATTASAPISSAWWASRCLRGASSRRPMSAPAPESRSSMKTFAKKFHLGRDVVGKRIGHGDAANAPLDVAIVGLVRDARNSAVKQTCRQGSSHRTARTIAPAS